MPTDGVITGTATVLYSVVTQQQTPSQSNFASLVINSGGQIIGATFFIPIVTCEVKGSILVNLRIPISTRTSKERIFLYIVTVLVIASSIQEANIRLRNNVFTSDAARSTLVHQVGVSLYNGFLCAFHEALANASGHVVAERVSLHYHLALVLAQVSLVHLGCSHSSKTCTHKQKC